MGRRFHSPADVQRGVDRFLSDFRASFGTDAEPELAEPELCIECETYPAAYLQKCFSCHTKDKVAS